MDISAGSREQRYQASIYRIPVECVDAYPTLLAPILTSILSSQPAPLSISFAALPILALVSWAAWVLQHRTTQAYPYSEMYVFLGVIAPCYAVIIRSARAYVYVLGGLQKSRTRPWYQWLDTLICPFSSRRTTSMRETRKPGNRKRETGKRTARGTIPFLLLSALSAPRTPMQPSPLPSAETRHLNLYLDPDWCWDG